PPAGTEEDLAAGVAFVPVMVKGFGQGDLVVEERYPTQVGSDFQSLEARAAITDYLKSGAASPAERTQLQKILELGTALSDGADNESKLRREQAELEKASRETRLSIEAIEKNPQAAALRAELTERLRKTTARLDQITKELVTIGLRRSENEVRMKQAVEGLYVPPPDRRPGAGAAPASPASPAGAAPGGLPGGLPKK
ncbi:MAG TPA: hypothetical protein VLC09_07215, partial [Polyangiaceae bacterium]|nr:hypothetical protein [Polyangiaceae bacterium]